MQKHMRIRSVWGYALLKNGMVYVSLCALEYTHVLNCVFRRCVCLLLRFVCVVWAIAQKHVLKAAWAVDFGLLRTMALSFESNSECRN